MSHSKGNRWSPYRVIQENLFHPLEDRPKPFFNRTIIIDDYLDNRKWFTPGVAIGKGGGATLADAFPPEPTRSGAASPENLEFLDTSLEEYEHGRSLGLNRLFETPQYEGDYADTAPVTPSTSPFTPYSSPKGKRKETPSFPSTPSEEYSIPVTPIEPGSITPSGPPTPYKNSELARKLPGGIQLRNQADLDHWSKELLALSQSYRFGAGIAADRLYAIGETKKAKRLSDSQKAATHAIKRLQERKGDFEKQKDIYRGAKFSLLRLEKQLQSVTRKIDKKGIGRRGKVEPEKK